ncbi:MAG: hypothetical protein MUE53_06290 [Chitinophagales bacterium]|nr:hypothetical protein [Chitinophagales bacterium]
MKTNLFILLPFAFFISLKAQNKFTYNAQLHYSGPLAAFIGAEYELGAIKDQVLMVGASTGAALRNGTIDFLPEIHLTMLNTSHFLPSTQLRVLTTNRFLQPSLGYTVPIYLFDINLGYQIPYERRYNDYQGVFVSVLVRFNHFFAKEQFK